MLFSGCRGWPTNTLHGHMRELPLPGFKATALQTRLWKGHFWKTRGPTLISEGTSGGRTALISHWVSITLPFHSVLWPAPQRTVCSAITSHHPSACPGFCFCSPLRQSTGLETLWNKNIVAKCTNIWTGSRICTQKSQIKQIPNN